MQAKGERIGTYTCNYKKSHGVESCSNRGVQQKPLEALVLSKIEELIFDEARIPEIAAAYNRLAEEESNENLVKIQNLKHQVQTLDAKIANIVNVIATTGSAALANQLTVFERDKELLQVQIQELEQSSQTGKLSIEALTKEFKKAQELFRSGELDQIEQLLNLFLEKVLVFPDYVEIYINNVPINLKETENEEDEPTVSSLENFQVVTRPETIQKECVFPIHADYLIKLNTNAGFCPEASEKSEKITRVRNNSNSSNYGGPMGRLSEPITSGEESTVVISLKLTFILVFPQ